MASRPYLRALAHAVGILPGFVDATGRRRTTTDRTRAALLTAMGFNVASEAAAASALGRFRSEQRARRRDFEDEWLVVAPEKCLTCEQVLGRSRGFGIWANLYTLRSSRNWGSGDIGDLRELIRWAGRQGADFVGINPLHAVDYSPNQVSPYSPTTRLFRNPLYLRIEDIPEFAEWRQSGRTQVAGALRLAETRRADRAIAYDEVLALRNGVLRELFDIFSRRHLRPDSARGAAFQGYRQTHPKLLLFAAFLTLSEYFRRKNGPIPWPNWPATLREPDSPAFESFCRDHSRDLDFHCFLQFELDRQLREAAKVAKRAGLALGLFHDLALGSAADGFDTWACRDSFASGVTIGAPPDSHSRSGQNWNVPPLIPWKLSESGYQYWIDVLRGTMPHAGMIRIDHVMGLFRQFWIPKGRPAVEGAYVRYPAEHLLAILAAESHRHGTVVVGEDLGTVPREVPPALERRGILSTRLLYFEQDGRNRFRPAAKYHRNAVVMTNTHDHVPLAGFLTGADLRLRRTIRVIRSDRALRKRLRERGREVAELLARLAVDGLLEAERPLSYGDILCAAQRFLCRAPCPLVAVGLDDLASEQMPVNLPGVPQARFASWARRMNRSLEDLTHDAGIQRLLKTVRRTLGDKTRTKVRRRMHQ